MLTRIASAALAASTALIPASAATHQVTVPTWLHVITAPANVAESACHSKFAVEEWTYTANGKRTDGFVLCRSGKVRLP